MRPVSETSTGKITIVSDQQEEPSTLSALDANVDASLTREALYELVWSEPMLKVAARFGVSSSYMARICTLLNVPRPERGYWAKLAVDKAPKQPALPDPRPGDPLEWSRDGTPPIRARPLPKPPEKKRHKRHKARTPLPDRHPLTTDAKPLFEAGGLSYSAGYLKPSKRLLVDLAVTKTGLDKALSFANQLFLAMETRGHRVLIASNSEQFCRAEVDEREHPEKNRYYNNLWAPQRCTIVYIGTVAIGLTIIEISEEVEARYVNGEYVRLSDYVPKRRGRYALDSGWTSEHEFPTGRLCLQAYSPYPRAQWTRQWRETKKRAISTQIPAIARELEKATVEVARLVEEGERQAELEHQRWVAQMEQWDREEAERRAAKALKESKEELLEIIEMWATSRRLEEFFADAEHRLKNLPECERTHTMVRLRRARKLIGSTDALARFQSWKTPEER
jgi:hypothetical protein